MALWSSKEKTKTVSDPMRRDQVVAWQNRLFNLLDRPFEFYPEQTYADLTPEQIQALQMREQFAGEMPEGILGPATAAWQSTLTAPDVAANPYVNAMLDVQREQAVGALEEDVLPMLRSRAIGTGEGGLGSSRSGVAQGRAVGETMDALTRAAAATQLGAYGQGLQAQQYGIGAAPSMAAMGTMPSDIMMGVGDVYRGMDQLGIDEAMARHEYAQNEPWMRLERFATPYMAMSQPYGTTTRTEHRTPSALQVAGQLAGMGLVGMQGYNTWQGGGGPPSVPSMPATGAFSGAGSVPIAMNTMGMNAPVPNRYFGGPYGGWAHQQY